jgi:hypothetical protein
LLLALRGLAGDAMAMEQNTDQSHHMGHALFRRKAWTKWPPWQPLCTTRMQASRPTHSRITTWPRPTRQALRGRQLQRQCRRQRLPPA